MEMINNDIIIEGNDIFTESDFHDVLNGLLNLGPYYGRNLDALWDRLSSDVERPVTIIWLNSNLSKQRLGEFFEKVVVIFKRTKQQDMKYNWDEKFDYILN